MSTAGGADAAGQVRIAAIDDIGRGRAGSRPGDVELSRLPQCRGGGAPPRVRGMIGFCEAAWADTAALRAAIDALPFNRELAAGTLARERFQFYITQDALYLGQFSRALAIAAAKAPDA